MGEQTLERFPLNLPSIPSPLERVMQIRAPQRQVPSPAVGEG